MTAPPLDPAWTKAAQKKIQEEHPGARLIYTSLKGSRLNGVAGPTSDVDLRCVFITPTESLLGLKYPKEHVEESFTTVSSDGVVDEIDFVAYEVRRFFELLQTHNGNMVESLLVPEGFYDASIETGPEGLSLRALGKLFLTKKLYNFYRGYAQSQYQRASKQLKTGKGLIATYRELYEGILILRTGQPEFNLPLLTEKVEDLIGFHSKVLPNVRRDRVVVDDSLLRKADAEYVFLNEQLDEALTLSSLPEDFDGTEIMTELLQSWRMKSHVLVRS